MKPHARLKPDQWRAIRRIWEYDPDEPTYEWAAEQAGAKHKFKPPSIPAVCKRAKREKWERRGSLAGINQASHRIADRLGEEDRYVPHHRGDGVAYDHPDTRPDSVKAEYEERHDAECRRAEIRVRHRREWEQVAVLRQESLKHRKDNPDQAFFRLKITKMAAETTAIQQNGECKAWGMDELIDQGRLKSMSDAQLEALIAGKKVS